LPDGVVIVIIIIIAMQFNRDKINTSAGEIVVQQLHKGAYRQYRPEYRVEKKRHDERKRSKYRRSISRPKKRQQAA
jgi:hypothetical protein